MANKKDIHTFQFDQLEIEALVEILTFAGQTAAYLAHKEVAANRAGKDLTRLARIANDSNDFIKIIGISTDIGEPDSDAIN